MEPINLYTIKASRMSDTTLLFECSVNLKAVEFNKADIATKERTRILLTEALNRPSLKEATDTFKTALAVLKHMK